jgi:predicted AlkP superfamily pyrophosphatase or phosphodiesterase
MAERQHASQPTQIVVLIDAFGWRFAQEFDFLADVLPYRNPLRTILGYSSGAIPTMLTGKSPAEHGHWNLFFYDPDGSPFRWMVGAGRLPRRVLDNRYSRKALKELGKRVLGLGPLFEVCVRPSLLPLFNFVEKRNIYAPGGINGDSSIFDELAAAGVPHRVYTYHRYRDAEILAEARRELTHGTARFLFLYLSELDGFLHTHRTDAGLLKAKFGEYEHALRELYEVASAQDPEVGFSMFSDHGMAPVGQYHDVAADVDALPLRMPDDYLAVYDSTMARFWFFSDSARRSVLARLSQLTCGRLLEDQELAELGIRFDDRRYGDVVFLMHPGWLITSSEFNSGRWVPSGMHGYHPDDADSDAIFLSNRKPSQPLRTIADAYGYMREAAGLAVERTTRRNGERTSRV